MIIFYLELYPIKYMQEGGFSTFLTAAYRFLSPCGETLTGRLLPEGSFPQEPRLS